jgi:hypothetical protein
MKNILYGITLIQKGICLKHILRILRIQLALLFVCCMGIGATDADSQEVKISFVAKNAAVREILRQIEDKTDFLFLYNQEEVDVNRKTSMNVRKKNVPEILSELFNATDVRYIVEGTNIVLVKLPPAARPTIAGRQTGRRITGTVVDATGEPVVGANVVEKGVPANGTVTDVDGNFSLTVADNAVLQISFMGYITQEISVLSAGGGGSLQSSC